MEERAHVLEKLTQVFTGVIAQGSDGQMAAKTEDVKEEQSEISEDAQAAIKLLEEASDLKGKFPLHDSKVGGWWSYDLKNDPLMRARYDAIGKKYTAQREFRDKWVATKLAEKRKSKSKIDVEEAYDECGGIYTCFTNLWKSQGGDAAGLEAAMKHARKALDKFRAGVLIRGRPWIIWNDMTERHEFLDLKMSFTERVGSKWQIATEYSTGSAADPPAQADQVTRTRPETQKLTSKTKHSQFNTETDFPARIF